MVLQELRYAGGYVCLKPLWVRIEPAPLLCREAELLLHVLFNKHHCARHTLSSLHACMPVEFVFGYL